MKAIATALLVLSVAVAVAARLMQSRHWSLGYVAAWAEAAAVGGLADWYAVVALFRHPCGIPFPHTAIVSSNRERIARSFGDFVEEQFLAPEPIAQKLRSVDFAAQVSEWLANEDRSLSLSQFALRLMPQALSAIEETGLRSFMAQHVVDQLEALDLAPLAAKLLSTMVEDQRHQRIFDEILVALDRILQDEQTLAAVREKIRGELPSLFNIFRADAFVLRRMVALISSLIHEAGSNPDHALRHDFDRFVREFVEKLESSPEYAERAELLKRELLARPEIRHLAEDLWQSVIKFLKTDARDGNSIVEFHLARFLTQLGRKLADEPRLGAEINAGVVKVLLTFVQTQKHEIARFITDQIRSWDIALMVRIIELNIGPDLQYIRLNGTLIGGLAGLGLYAGEHALGLR